MAIPTPWDEPETAPESPDLDPNWGRERERDRAGARVYRPDGDCTSDDNVSWGPWPTASDTESDDASSTEVSVRPEPGALAKLGDASKVWWSDAKVTATEAFDGTVLRARPPSIRDRYTRIRRATWAGDLDGLRKFGQIASIPPLILYITCQAVAWLCAPLRFYVFLAIAVLIVVLAI
jgi:hypothetical protein